MYVDRTHLGRSEVMARGGRGLVVVGLHVAVIYIIATCMGIIHAPAIVQPLQAMIIESTQQSKPVQPVVSKPQLEQPALDVQIADPQPQIDVPVETNTAPDPDATQTISDANLQVTRRVEPTYPPASRRAGEQGSVVVNVLVDERGHPQQVKLQNSSGYDKLDQAALQAIQRWVFNPAVRGSQKVTAWTTVRVTFKLENA